MADNFDYDVLVIGSGPGGYVAAIRAAQLGLRTACVESRETLGGTCLNVGCIPSKALLHASELYKEASSGEMEKFGIKIKSAELDLDMMHAEKNKAVGELTGGIEFLFKKNKVTWIKGRAAFSGTNSVNVDGQSVTAKDIIIATGSSVMSLPGVEVDNDKAIVVDSTGALNLPKVPEHLLVIGGGVIGLELGSVWGRLGAKVTVIEYLDQILPGMDGSIRKDGARIFKKQGFDIKTSTKVTGVSVKGQTAFVSVEPAKGGDSEIIEADAVLVCIGRRANTDGLNLAAAGLEKNARGQVEMDHRMQTSVKNIWAIGDVAPGLMLAHRAEDEGIAVAENIAGQTGIVNHDIIPSVVYTHPEMASVGKTEEELKEAGIKYNVGKFPFAGNSRAKTNRDTEGFVKILADAETDRILGAHIISSLAGTLIAQIAQAMEFGGTSEDIAYTCHAHPTHSEAIKEAAMDVMGKPIHI